MMTIKVSTPPRFLVTLPDGSIIECETEGGVIKVIEPLVRDASRRGEEVGLDTSEVRRGKDAHIRAMYLAFKRQSEKEAASG